MKLIGTVGRDPDVKFLDSGTAVCSFSVAVDEFKKQGQKWEKTGVQWFRVVSWGDEGQAIAEAVKKGDSVIVWGALKMSSYEKDGEKQAVIEVTARTVGVVPKPLKKHLEKGEDPWQ